MKVFLMFQDRDFVLSEKFPPLVEELIKDLELDILFEAMAAGDDYLARVAKAAFLSSLHDVDVIRYRQEILRDCLENGSVVRGMYALAVETIEKRKRAYLGGIFSRYPSSVLSGALELLQLLVEQLRKLRNSADEYGSRFTSKGFVRLFGMLREKLDDGYLNTVQEQLKELRFRKGVLLSASLRSGNVGNDYTLRQFPSHERNWMRAMWQKASGVFVFY